MSPAPAQTRTSVLLLFILATGAIRVLQHTDPVLSPLTNFSPLGAMALFGGAHFGRSPKAFAFPLLSLLASDLILANTVFRSFSNGFLYGGWYWVYGAFALMVLAGTLLKKISVGNVLTGALACVFIHWIVTDFGVWWNSTVYPPTLSGYAACLVAALPFEANFLAGTALYGVLLFGGYALLQQRNEAAPLARQ